jgi:hypothetical protein
MFEPDVDQHPTREELHDAHRTFGEYESRDLFYRAATDLVTLALRGETSINVAEALAVLLQTWNRSYYRFHPATAQHFEDLEAVLAKDVGWLADIRRRSIDSFGATDEAALISTFDDFEFVLGPVGAAKALHLLAPNFLPLWDGEIARTYGLGLARTGLNGPRYVRMTRTVQAQVARLGGAAAVEGNPLKRIDEYNYCHYTKGWM